MKKGHLLVLVSVLAIFSLVLSACSGSAPAANTGDSADGETTNMVEQIKKNGVIRIAVPEDTPLFGTIGADGQHTGYDVDVANMLGADMGVTV